MITGIIDVGSNTMRMSIYKHENENFQIMLNKKIIAGLANFIEKDELSPKGIERLCTALEYFRDILITFEVTSIYVFATASLRYINNAENILDIIRDRTGMEIEIISGEQEAYLDFVGSQHMVKMSDGLIVDIGGASCEIVTVKQNCPEKITSIPIGCLSLGLMHIDKIIAKNKEIKSMKETVKEQFLTSGIQFDESAPVICGVGGTIRAMLTLAKELSLIDKNASEVSASDAGYIIKRLKAKDKDVYQAVARAIPERIFTILPGALILKEIIKNSYAEKIIISKGGVREGYLLDRVIRKTT